MGKHKVFKNREEAFRYAIESKEKVRRKFSKLTIEDKLKIVEELKQTSLWLKNTAKMVKKGL
ncbi:MAG: hypothetical protein HY097_08200 [Nitrospinae bacterium]|nr:hypothetical protein [Nitrospinota bacterium]MBI3813194.1 hypothetical protein [Nitrospinota bacterium]